MSTEPPFDKDNGTTPPSRRKILTASTIALGGAGACALAAPFLESLEGPGADLRKAESDDKAAIMEVDLSDLKRGDHKQIKWKNWPVFIQYRTKDMIAALKEPALKALLRDPDSKIRQQPKDAVNDYRSINPDYAILIGICTHLGCIPNFRDVKGYAHKGGFFCPCHGSQFDNAGRVLKDMPAPYNLPVPPARFIKPTILRLGESAAEPHFSMNDIQQI
ncbi:ubiquinol-cytochrome c reductase iron-sulfur subunit [Aristophania vespae]|uniref:ubiquinol-cytochrome c reductase iron-sulfur subunit n=1 Tax=Aristophania vespae TaxID=2697033 RepID=UPI0023510F62|nr:ubiquinol-cytochrome c reductase iron-sulfur subunit [Aristophania vespae]UMM63742.1 Ubiquinol-cytochrome c reductase iron-sulfur subunit [Aristophania vespae]